ncbi:MAG: uracil-xanthine permease [Clostridia bacterium]|nr:uracil-xanthine permease [Clostridia bacterium]
MKMIYQVNDRPKFFQLIVFALQQLLAIMTATLVVPVIINGTDAFKGALGSADMAMSPAAALVGAGVGTLVYVLFTKCKSPVFLGSSFSFIGSMTAAFAGATSAAAGYAGLIIGAAFAGLVYVIIAIIVKLVGVNWIDKLMPPAVIGSTVALIGLSLAGNAVSDISKGSIIADAAPSSKLLTVLCGIITLLVTVISSTYGKKYGKLIPFIFGILAGYASCGIFTIFGYAFDVESLKLLNVEPFQALVADGVKVTTFLTFPEFSVANSLDGWKAIDGTYISTIAVAYVPVAFVVFAEHLADHKNISSIIEKDLLREPGLHRTLLGDGVGSFAGALFGGCPNTTYGESVGCVAITKNASVYTIITAAIMAIVIAFIAPFVAFVNSIPSCVMGGVCMALYGFIAVSGLKMIQSVDLNQNKNLFVVSTILIAGVGGLTLQFGEITLTTVACALILGILVNIIVKKAKDDDDNDIVADIVAVEEATEDAE